MKSQPVKHSDITVKISDAPSETRKMQSMNSLLGPIPRLSITHRGKNTRPSWPSRWYPLRFGKPCPPLHTLPHYFLERPQQAERAGSVTILHLQRRKLDGREFKNLTQHLQADNRQAPDRGPGGLSTQPVFFIPG